jgi:septum formation protein
MTIILASTSQIRAQILARAGLDFATAAPRVDEEAIRDAMQADGASPRDIADSLAEAKALKISDKNAQALVLGCDQILALGDVIFTKPETPDHAITQLHALRGQTHHLYSAIVIYQNGQPLWRHIGHARLTMRAMSDQALASYVATEWESIRHSVGCYKIEERGIQLFSQIDGDVFTIQGLPLLPLLNYLALRGIIAS